MSIRPAKVPDDKLPSGFDLREKGLYYLEEKEVDDDKKKVTPHFICSPIRVLAASRDHDGEAWGRLIEFHDIDDGRHRWLAPMELFGGDPRDFLATLLRQGLRIAAARQSRQHLIDFVQLCRPKARIRCVERGGWDGPRFVLPDRSIGPAGSEEVMLQSRLPIDTFRVAGSIKEWKKTIGAWAQGNTRLTFALSAAFAAPLLTPLGEESAGFNFRGVTSSGKTTLIYAAGSVWGGSPAGQGFHRSWRSTDNGVEGLARAHCDCLLAMDDIGQAPPDLLGDMVYLIANGQPKTRMNREASLRASVGWRVLLLSTGETTFAQRMAESRFARTPRGGQEARLADLPADAGMGMGAFEELHSYSDGDAFSRRIKAASLASFGHAGRQYLEALTANRDELLVQVRADIAKAVEKFTPPDVIPKDKDEQVKRATGQVRRVVRHFAIVAAAGELATRLGILPWANGEATNGVETCCKAWLYTLASVSSPTDLEAGLSAVRHFLEKYGDSRFALLYFDEKDKTTNPVLKVGDLPSRERAGFRKYESDQTNYYVMPQVWRREICAGFDPLAVARYLRDLGFLHPGEDNHLAQYQTIPGLGRPRVYCITSSLLA